jgi:hypothetical protein
MKMKRRTLLVITAGVAVSSGCALFMSYDDYGDQPRGAAGNDASVEAAAEAEAGAAGSSGSGGSGGSAGAPAGGSGGGANGGAGGIGTGGAAGGAGIGGAAGGSAGCGGPCGGVPAARKVCVNNNDSDQCVDAYRIFVSSTSYDGKVTPATADKNCMDLASNLGGTWKAWLSTAANSPGMVPTPNPDLPFFLPIGIRVAANWAALLSAGSVALESPIDFDETNAFVPTSNYVWTGTKATGLPADNCNPAYTYCNCSDFTSNDAGYTGIIGDPGATDKGWTQFTATYCSMPNRLYCFEQ